MTGAVNVSVVTLSGLVLNVSGVDCDTALSLFGSLIDVSVINESSVALKSENLCDSSCKGGLTVVNVADSTNVNVRLIGAYFFRTFLLPLEISSLVSVNPVYSIF